MQTKSKAYAQQFLAPLFFLATATAALLYLFKSNTDSSSNTAAEDSLQKYTNVLLAQLEHSFSLASLISFAAWQFFSELNKLGTLPGAAAQTDAITSAQFPRYEINSVAVSSTVNTVVYTANASLAYWVGDGSFCIRKFNMSNPLLPQQVTQYGPTTINANNCVNFALNADETLGLTSDNQGGGVSVVTLTGTSLKSIGQLSGFNAVAATWVGNQSAYVITDGYVETRMFVVNLNDYTNPTLIKTIIYPWLDNAKLIFNDDRFGYAFFYGFTTTANSLVISRAVFPNPGKFKAGGQNFPGYCETNVLVIDASNASYPVTQGKITWQAILNFDEQFAAIKNMRAFGTQLGLPYNVAFYGKSDRTPVSGMSLLDVSNPYAPAVSRRYTATEANAVDFTANRKLAAIATNAGISIVNFNQLIPSDAPVTLAQWSLPNGCQNVKISADGRFVSAVSGGTFYTFLLQDLLTLPNAGTTVIPLLSNGQSALKASSMNDGMLTCFTGKSGIKQIPCATDTNTSWFQINADGAFHATPPDDAVGFVTIGINNQTAAFTIQVMPGDTTTNTTTTTTTSTTALTNTTQPETTAIIESTMTDVPTTPRTTRAGINHPPVFSNTNATTQIVALYDNYAISPALDATDPDGDPLTFTFKLNGRPLPDSIFVENNVAVGTCSQPGTLTFTVHAMDDSGLSAKMIYEIICKYLKPALQNPIATMHFPVGKSMLYTVSQNTFSGNNLQWYAKLSDGNPLPATLSFDSFARQISGYSNVDAILPMMIMVRDLFGNAANATFLMNFSDPGVIAKHIDTQTIPALKTVSLPIAKAFYHEYAPLAIVIALASNGAPIPSWLLYNPDNGLLTATPPAHMLNTKTTFTATARDPYGKSASTNFSIIVPANQPPQINTVLTNMTLMTGTLFSMPVPNTAFSSPENYSLTISASGLNASLPSFLTFVNSLLSGTPTRDDATDNPIPIVITGTDTLNDAVSQIFYLTITLSTWDTILHYLDITWKILAGIASLGVVTTAYGYYQQWPQLVNTVRGKNYIADIKFNSRDESDISAQFKGDIAVTSMRRLKPSNCVDNILATVASPFSYYWYGRNTLFKLANGDDFPRWLSFENGVLKLHRSEITDNDHTIVVQVSDTFGRIKAEYTINPQRYANTHTIEMTPRNSLTQPLLVTPQTLFTPPTVARKNPLPGNVSRSIKQANAA